MIAPVRRFGLALFVVGSLVGASFADRFAPPSPWLPTPDRPAEPGGVWSCPFVKAAGSPGWIHLANFGDVASHVRVTYVLDGRPAVTQAFDVGPGRAGTVGAPQAIRSVGAGAIVEYAGGEVVVSRTAFLTSNGGTGGAAAPCGRPGSPVLVASDGSTLGVETQIVILNPGTSDAVVDVALVFEGQELEPESLRGRVVPARGRLVIREGDFAFDKAAVAAVIEARSGRIVADTLLAAPGLIEVIPAIAPAGETVAIGSTAAGRLSFTAVAIGDVDAVTESRALTAAGQSVFEPLAAGLPPNTPRVSQIPPGAVEPGPYAVAVSSSTSPVALGARWEVIGRGGARDHAATVAAPPARRALAVMGPPANIPDLRFFVANPGEETVVSVRIVTEDGSSEPDALQNVVVGSGEAISLNIGALGGGGTVGVVLTSRGPVAAAIQAIASQPAFGAYAVNATPDLPQTPVAVAPDPRAGVPA